MDRIEARIRAGLCTHCGRENSDAGRYRMCPKCRAAQNEGQRRRRAEERRWREEGEARLRAKSAPAPYRPEKPALPLGEGQRQLCSRCAWARYEAGVIYCPLAVGSCARRGTMLRGVSSGLGVEPGANKPTTRSEEDTQ